jgi:trk system potassium uptake protein TrkA
MTSNDKAWRPERVAVIGLGRFGTSLARNLHDLGYEVTAVDISERRVADVANFVSLAAQGDGTDEELLRSLHIDRSDVAIVAQGENLEASVLTTLNLKRLKVGWVVAKARTALHGDLLERIGADQVVYPEAEAGSRLAHSLAVRHISDYISLTPSSGVAKVSAPAHFVGRTIEELGASDYARLNLLLIRRGRQLLVVPSYAERVQAGDELLLVGPDGDLSAFMDPARARNA